MAGEALELAKALIARRSVTPQDAGCQGLLAARLAVIGFHVERLRFGDVENLWARRGSETPLVVLAGHTDVVPPGPLEQWASDPFAPVVRDGRLYGRGAADMKSSLAAFVTAVEAFVARHRRHRGSIGLLVTSDEEGPAVDGTVKVVEYLQGRGERIDYCILGEPSSRETTGDVIKNGRRGSLSATLTVRGRQGHVAYPQFADNPIHRFAPALEELVRTRWDAGAGGFPPTTLQVSNIRAGTGADNVIPGSLEVGFNIRYSPALTDAELRRRIEGVLARHGLDYEIRWQLSGRPFITPPGLLVETVRGAVQEIAGITPRLSTDGGTSDGRFIAPTGAQVVELGPPNATVHQANECVAVEEIERLERIYLRILERLLAS